MKKILAMLLSGCLVATLFLSLAAPVSAASNPEHWYGWYEDEDGWHYYEGGSLKTGWQQIDGYWYYFDGSGTMKTGWIKKRWTLVLSELFRCDGNWLEIY